ncbi:MAG: PBP1A family penicillin-binding protein [Bdellovibrionaceae bacterium]|nr:PBP1A family penicillin-binding protein [Pseudobdellovibrionaceae bacterium]
MLGRKFWIRFALFLSASFVVLVIGSVLVYQSVKASLPQLITIQDYKPLLVSPVYDRNNKKIGEFARERRTLVPYDRIPKDLVNAFLAAEDDTFFQHGGINYIAILRAAVANLRAGHTVQGASTITQQVAKTLFLSSERTLLRKLREAMLSQQMENNLSKEEILYLYLNQIYFGQGAYGIENAAQTYFRKPVQKLELSEMAMLAGLPKAPSAYSPVSNPSRAKERQAYVLHRMAEVGFIAKDIANAETQKPIKVYVRETYEDFAPFFLETVRQMLVQQLGEEVVLDHGIRIQTSLDIEKQKAANESVIAGLKELDKRQGFRGALRKLDEETQIEEFLKQQRKKLLADSTPERTIMPDGKFAEIAPLPEKASLLPPFLKIGQSVEGVVREVNDALGYVRVDIADAKGLIDFETMKWARRPNTEKRYDLDQIKKPSDALKAGDVILVKIVAEKALLTPKSPPKNKKTSVPEAPQGPDLTQLIALDLDQEPVAEGALISFDQQNQDVLALVGGYNFQRNEYNRALQAARQTGSSFKAIVYASALDKGYNPSTILMDVPVVYEETKDDAEGQEETSVWKPSNHGKTFGGELTFRNALVRSLNIPTVKIMEDVGVPWATDYAKRLGIFSPLNPDFTLALGSSSVTLYEMTKVFAEFGRLGKRLRPVLIRKVEDRTGKTLLQNVSLDLRFEKELKPLDDEFENRRKAYLEAKAASPNPDQPTDPKKARPDKHFFSDEPDQLISPQTAYVMTSLLKGVVEDRMGTGGRARAIGREVAGKTGTTNGYFDAWFIGYTAQISTGVWVGFDKERSLGRGEVGGRSALPIWVEYMKSAHEGLPQMTLPVPDGIVFANVDSDTGKLASASTKTILRQAFVEGTEPTESASQVEEEKDFYKQDLTE